MSGHRFLFDLFNAIELPLQDPGESGELSLLQQGAGVYHLTGSGSRSIPDPVKAGLTMVLAKVDSGTVTVTADSAIDQAGNTTLTFDNEGDAAILVSVPKGSGYVYRAIPFGVGGPGIERANLAEESLVSYPITMEKLRVWDAVQTNLPGTAASDDLALIVGTFLTSDPVVRTSDAKAATVTQKARFQFQVPAEYVAGHDAKIRLNVGMGTTASDGTATIDVQVVRSGAPTVDLCITNAQSINSLTAANKDFVLDATNLVPGDILDVVMTIAITDSATGTAVLGVINKVEMLLDIKG